MLFPSILPLPNQDYTANSNPFLASNEFETNIRQRRRYTKPLESIQVSWQMTQLELDIFQAFVAYSLQQGALPFEITIVGLDGLKQRTASLRGGVFTKKYVAHGYWQVTAILITTEPDLLEEAGFPDLLDILALDVMSDQDLFIEMTEAFYIYLNETYGQSYANTVTAAFMAKYSTL